MDFTAHDHAGGSPGWQLEGRGGFVLALALAVHPPFLERLVFKQGKGQPVFFPIPPGLNVTGDLRGHVREGEVGYGHVGTDHSGEDGFVRHGNTHRQAQTNGNR